MGEIDSDILRTIIDTAHDHFFVVDAGGRVRDVSPAAAAVYGMSREDLCRTTVQALEAQGVLKPSVSLEVMRSGKPAQLMQVTGTGRRVIAQAHPVFRDGQLAAVVSRSMASPTCSCCRRSMPCCSGASVIICGAAASPTSPASRPSWTTWRCAAR